ncbi:MAG: DUF3106 domain-containing protein [Planctomycetota bacterium]
MTASSSRRTAQSRQIWFGVFSLWLAAGIGFLAGRMTVPPAAAAQELPATPEISQAASRWRAMDEAERDRYRRLYRAYRRHDERHRREIRRIARQYSRLDQDQKTVLDGCLERFESLSPLERRRLRPALSRQQRRLLSGADHPWLRFQALSELSERDREARLRRNERWSQLGDEQRRLLLYVLFGR